MGRKHQKWVWGLLAAAMLLGGCGAREPEETVPPQDLRETILNAAWAEQAEVDLRPCNTGAEALNAVYQELLYSGALPWYMGKSWSYDYQSDGTVVTLHLEYLDPAVYDRQVYEQAAVQVLAQAVRPGMTELQIALAVHDELAARCSYDESLTLQTEYDALVNGTAVCQGYAEAYMDLLHRAGVECIVVDSAEMNHSWNLVKVDGQWYHVDVTWDDPTPDIAGQVNHDHFLYSDDAFAGEAMGYHDWVSLHTAGDGRYDSGGFWTDVNSQICYADADTCYLRRRTEDGYQALRRTESTGEETPVYTWEVYYADLGRDDGKRVHYQTAGLSVTQDALYVTDIDRIRRVELETGAVTAVYKHDTAQTHQVLVGSRLDGQILTITAMNEEQETEQIQIVLTEP